MATGHIISRRKLLAASAAASSAPFWLSRQSRAAAPGVLVELFTSQGCSSCPPADAFAGELTTRPDVMVLSFNVDYWDYLGWRDTLAKPEYSQRQYDYARSRGDGKVYTPQMVINGRSHTVGSSKSSVLNLIGEAQNLPATVKLSVAGNEIQAEVQPFAYSGEATLWLMAVEEKAVQKIARGENAGSNITYYNAVRSLVPAAMWKGEPLKASWPTSAVMSPNAQFCVAVLQEGKTGPVLGIARA